MKQLLELKAISKSFKSEKGNVLAVNDVSLTIKPGESLGLVGESGCGKSTVAKLISHLEKIDSGNMFLFGKDITKPSRKQLKELYTTVQMVFQNPRESFNPRMKLGNSIMEGMLNSGMPRKEARTKAIELLETCGLSKEFYNRYPYQVSGGECQRASIARAIALNPQLLICDEATSALDVTVQAQIVKLLKHLNIQMNMAYLFISHDIALIQDVCDRVLVMYDGEIIEEGTPDEIINNPQKEYTEKLVNAVFEIG